MSEISPRTALEIFTNPKDLAITIGRESEGAGKFCIGIFRGPGHRFKPIVTSKPFADTLDQAINQIKEILLSACECARTELENPTSIISTILNPGGESVDEREILNQEITDRILADLLSNQAANTYNYE